MILNFYGKEISAEKTNYLKNIRHAAEFIRMKSPKIPKYGLILDFPMSQISSTVKDSVIIAYEDIPHFSSTSRNNGYMQLGTLFGKDFCIMQGRINFFEGHRMQSVVFPVRVMKELGIEVLIVSNSCGSINKNFEVNNFMVIKDHINLIGNPLIGPNLDIYGERFSDLSFAYDIEFRKIIKEVAEKKSIKVHEGVYLAVTGPSYETPAEIKFFNSIGADSIGMSTAPEVIVARHMSVKVLGLAFLSNFAAGVSNLDDKIHDVEILSKWTKGQEILLSLIEGFVEKL